jgi:hypothetical protein
VKANNQQRQVKGARLLGPEQHQVKRYAQYDKVDDILPPKPIYQRHISHWYWHDGLDLGMGGILMACVRNSKTVQLHGF